MKIACSFFYTDDRYESLAKIAIKSFKVFNPDIDVFVFNKENIDTELVSDYTAGYCKYYYASTLFDKGYTKIISLSVDTITCGKVNEFINNNEDVLVSLDFNYGINYNGISVQAHQHFNGDVVCFNNKKFVDDLLEIMRNEPISQYLEQGVLSQILFIQPNIYSHKVLDIEEKGAIYNCRLYYTDEANNSNFHKDYPYPFRVENNELISPLNKLIKVIHLVRGFGTMDKNSFVSDINTIRGGMFNDETKKFFLYNKVVDEDWFNATTKLEEFPEIPGYESKTQAGFPIGRKTNVTNDENLLERFEKKFKK